MERKGITMREFYKKWDETGCKQWVNGACMIHTPVIFVKDTKKHWAHKIAEWHVKDNKWSNPGYTFVIEFDGTIYFCPETSWNQIHCRSAGQNSNSLGICLVGDGTKQEPSLQQLSSLENLIKIHKIKEIRYHRDFSPKECPGDKVIDTISRSQLKHLVKRYK